MSRDTMCLGTSTGFGEVLCALQSSCVAKQSHRLLSKDSMLYIHEGICSLQKTHVNEFLYWMNEGEKNTRIPEVGIQIEINLKEST